MPVNVGTGERGERLVLRVILLLVQAVQQARRAFAAIMGIRETQEFLALPDSGTGETLARQALTR